MARPKKDGRYINYYIDREIYERLKNMLMTEARQ